MKRTYFAIPMLILALATTGCRKDSSSGTDEGSAKMITDYVVRNNEIAGWTHSGAAWTASNVSELTTYINGLAEVYRRHGFVEAAHQEYQGTVNSTQRQLKLTVYFQGLPAHAAALYADPDLGFGGALDWTGGAGQAAHYVRNGGLSQVLSFYQGPFFVSLEINTDTDESLNILKQFALNVDGKITNG
jgi:hypothetical protein